MMSMRPAHSVVLLIAAAAGSSLAQGRPCDPPAPLGPSRDLYCIELVPAPGIAGVVGRIELAPPPGPFTVSVTADGRSRAVPIVFLHGLPPAAELGRSGSAQYVAWAAPPQMSLVVPLRAAGNRPTPPLARAREVIPLADGDTVWLEAGIVRRSRGGQSYTMYAFNGQSPGPLLEVARGAAVVVAFTNHLAESTTVHWHGIRLENRFDGDAELTQPAAPPGGAFTYPVRFPDAASCWCHPHVREDVH